VGYFDRRLSSPDFILWNWNPGSHKCADQSVAGPAAPMRRLWQRVGSSSSRRLCCNALHRARPHPELLGNLVQASPLRLRQPLKAASVKCIRAQFRTRDLLRDFRRPRPCCTHGCLPPIEPLLSPAHYFRRSKKLLPRHFHDPPPDRARTPSDDSDNAPRSRPSHGRIS